MGKKWRHKGDFGNGQNVREQAKTVFGNVTRGEKSAKAVRLNMKINVEEERKETENNVLMR